jgi:hypothetical protein
VLLFRLLRFGVPVLGIVALLLSIAPLEAATSSKPKLTAHTAARPKTAPKPYAKTTSAQKPVAKPTAKSTYIAKAQPKTTTTAKTASVHKPPAKPVAKAPAKPPVPKVAAAPPSIAIAHLGEGVLYKRFQKRLASGPVRVSVLEIDPQASGIEIMPVLAHGKMGGKTSVANMVNQHQAIAGINGSFFKPDVGIPLGILMINQELISGPIYDRVALGITKDNRLVMDRVHLAGEVVLPNGHRVALHNVNQPRVNEGHTVLYSARWGYRAPKVPADGLQILLRNGRIAAVSTTQPLDIPPDGMVISGTRSPALQELASLPLQTPVQVNVYTLPDWSGMKHAIGGGPWLVRNGRPYVDLTAQHFSTKGLGHREPRSAVGITKDGKMLLVAVDGRQAGSIGMTLWELSHLMQELGAEQAMNLDGGSSTQMAVRGRIVNQPSAGQIGVSNSLIVRQLNQDNMALQNKNENAF